MTPHRVIKCQVCGVTEIPATAAAQPLYKYARYCSTACKQKASRERLKRLRSDREYAVSEWNRTRGEIKRVQKRAQKEIAQFEAKAEKLATILAEEHGINNPGAAYAKWREQGQRELRRR